jgi:hypothetical protein
MANYYNQTKKGCRAPVFRATVTPREVTHVTNYGNSWIDAITSFEK